MREPRQPLFDGYRPVRALWFDVALLGEQAARKRVLAHWERGARLFQADGGYLLAWPHARRRRVDALDGLALCETGAVLSSGPLTPSELADAHAGSWWCVRGTEAHALVPQARLDPSAWLDLRAIVLREPLAPPAIKAAHDIALAEPAKALADILGAAMPVPSARQQAFIQAAQQPARGVAGVAGALAAGGIGILGWLITRRSHGPAQPGAGGEPWSTALARMAARVAMFTRVSRLLGWRQANYLRSMLTMFEKGDLEQALRHAIALGSEQSARPRPALGTPQARSKLDVTRHGAGTAVIGLDAELEQHLRATYRRTFDQLDRAGRIDEAVFVLAELLRCGLEAVTYLEKKERFEQAAQLAATLELAPELRVRLWLLAGEVDRAIGLARLHNSFADAVRQLEKTQHAHAPALRREWAHYLAARGELAEAVDAIWPLHEEHGQARMWLAAAQAAGGTPGVRALVRTLALLPDALATQQGAIVNLLDAQGSDGVQLRARLATEIIALPAQSAATRRVARLLARYVIAERHQGLNQLDRNALDKLLDIGESALLRADLPSLKVTAERTGTPLAKRSVVLTLTLAERGLLPIHDAVHLPDGQYLLALGEGGAVRVNARGRQLAHYPVPAFHIVVADNGQRALVLARRDAIYRISRIDLVTNGVADWLALPLRFWSERYDGVTWDAVLEQRLVALDTTAARLSVSWQVDLPGAVIGYNDAGVRQAMLLATADGGVEQWAYAQPGRQLRQRDAWPAGDTQLYPNPSGDEPWRLAVTQDATGTRLLQPVGMAFPVHCALDVQLRQQSWLIAASHATQAICYIASLGGQARATVTLAHPDHERMRLQDHHVLVFDRAGRLADIDTRDGAVTTLLLS